MASKNKNCMAITGENKEILAIFTLKTAYLHDLTNEGKLIEKIDVPDMTFGGISIAAGKLYFSALKGSQFFYLLLLQLGLFRVAALKVSPYIIHSADYIFLLVL